MRRVDIFRHGQANYNQGFVHLKEDANDLTESGVKETLVQAELLATDLCECKQVVFLASPLGRAMQTAALLQSKIDGPITKVVPSPVLQEQVGFSWDLIKTLTEGGEFDGPDGLITVDSEITNPNHKDIYHYSSTDIRQITPTFWEGKESLHRKAMAIEPSENVGRRINTVLKVIAKKSQNDIHPVLVTHDALIRPLMKQAGITPEILPTSGRLEVVSNAGQLFVVRVNGISLKEPKRL